MKVVAEKQDLLKRKWCERHQEGPVNHLLVLVQCRLQAELFVRSAV